MYTHHSDVYTHHTPWVYTSEVVMCIRPAGGLCPSLCLVRLKRKPTTDFLAQYFIGRYVTSIASMRWAVVLTSLSHAEYKNHAATNIVSEWGGGAGGGGGGGPRLVVRRTARMQRHAAVTQPTKKKNQIILIEGSHTLTSDE